MCVCYKVNSKRHRNRSAAGHHFCALWLFLVCVCVCVLQSKLQKASKSQCSTRNSQRAQKLSTHFSQCVCVYVCVCSGIVLGVWSISDSVRFVLSQRAGTAVSGLNYGCRGFSCLCATRVPDALAVGAVLLCLWMVPRWHRVRCDVLFRCMYRVLACLLYTSPSPRDRQKSRMPSSA